MTSPDARMTGCPLPPPMPEDGTPFAPPPAFARWRADAPATRLRAADGTVGWLVTGYELARAVFEDPRMSATNQRYPLSHGFFVDAKASDDYVETVSSANVLSLDPPQHTRVRRAVTSRFSVRSVRARLPHITVFIAARLDEVMESGHTTEVFADLALPLSVFTHCEVLGIPQSHRQRFIDYYITESWDPDRALAFTRELMELRRHDPGEDTISDLLSSDLTEAERASILTILMGAGRDAIAYMIPTSIAALLLNPGELARLHADPALIPAAVEELMRFDAMFVTAHPRTALESFELGGIAFDAGEPVWVSTVAANRDPERFPEPDRLDVTRDAFGHLTFGHGVHGCIGQQLARVVVTEAIRQLIDRMPHMRLVEAEQLQSMGLGGPVAVYPPGRVTIGW